MVPRASVATVLLALGILHSGQDGPIAQVSRVLGSLADVVETSSKTALLGIEASSNLSYDATLWFREVWGVGMGTVKNALRGVDLVNFTVGRGRGSVVVSTNHVFTDWLETTHGREVVQLPSEATSQMAALANSVSFYMPKLDFDKTVYTPRHRYFHLKASAGYKRSGHLYVEWSGIYADYALQWCNPLWVFLGFPPEIEVDLVTLSLSRLINTTPVVELPASVDLTPLLPLGTKIKASAKRVFYGMCFLIYGPLPGD